jgi:hypothetical protein
MREVKYRDEQAGGRMSFTEEELQAFNSILETRFAAHRQDMEQALEQKLNTFRQEIEQRFTSFHAGTASILREELIALRDGPETDLAEQLDLQRNRLALVLNQEADQKLQQVEASVDRMLAAQLLGIEQLLNQHASREQMPSQIEAIEVQTDLLWEGLGEVMGKVLDTRLSTLDTSLQNALKELEHDVAQRLRQLREELIPTQVPGQPYGQASSNGSLAQDLLAGIEHLERVIESMQVAMTANHALLSNRLYHHQQLPLERAHPVGRPQVTPAEEAPSLLAQAKERLASGLDPGIPASADGDETTGH